VEKYGTVRQVTADSVTRCMRFACGKTKTTGTDSKYVILITFSRRKWLHERALILILYECRLSCYLIQANITMKIQERKSNKVRDTNEVCS
jgi:hypothetical protein